jgi:hypothetical protein
VLQAFGRAGTSQGQLVKAASTMCKIKEKKLTIPVIAVSDVPCIQDSGIRWLNAGVRIPCFERQRRLYLINEADKVERHETLNRMLFAHSVN